MVSHSQVPRIWSIICTISVAWHCILAYPACTARAGLGAPLMYDNNRMCGEMTGTLITATDTSTAAKCQAAVVLECDYKTYFTWRSADSACRCVSQAACSINNGNTENTNGDLTIYQVNYAGKVLRAPLRFNSPPELTRPRPLS